MTPADISTSGFKRLLELPIRNRLVFIALAAALVAVGLSVPLTPAVNEDLAWLSYAAGRYLNGAVPYVELIETNPPAILFFNLPAVWFASVTGLPALPTFTGYVALVGAVSVLASVRLLRGAETIDEPEGRLLALALLTAVFTLAGRNFGQREHLMLVLLLPYFCAALVRLGNRDLKLPIAIGAGLVAGVGFSFKPHFLAILLAVEGLLWWHWRDEGRTVLRSETATIGGALAVYIVSIVFLTPEYFTLVDVFGEAYLGYLRVPLAAHLAQPAVLFAAVGLVGSAVVGVRPDWRPMKELWAAIVVGCVIGAALQLKAWSYHYYPAFAASMVLLAVLSFRGRGEFGSGRTGIARAACFGVFVLGLFGGLLSIDPIREESQSRLARLRSVADRIDAHCEAMPRIAILSPDAEAAFPLVTRFGYEWGLRFPTMQLVSAVYEGQVKRGELIRWHAIRDAPVPERFVFEGVVEDITSDPPDLLMVERRDSRRAFGHSGFGFVEYFSRDPTFRSLMNEYRLLGHWSGYRVWMHTRSVSCRKCGSVG